MKGPRAPSKHTMTSAMGRVYPRGNTGKQATFQSTSEAKSAALGKMKKAAGSPVPSK